MKAFILTLLVLLALPLAASADSDADLRRAKDYFEYGAYDRARDIVEELLEQNVLASDDQLIEANRVAGLAWFYGDSTERLAKAERYFLQLLSIEPEYRLDPFFTPPAAVQFFEEVKAVHEAQLAPIREQRRLAKEARRAEEEARRRFLEEQQRGGSGGLAGAHVERHNFALVFLPLGAGQFQNGDDATGIALAAVQIVAGLTSGLSYLAIENMRDDGGFSGNEVGTAQTLDAVKWASAAVFYGAWGYGIADALIHYESEVVRPSVRPLGQARPRAPAATGSTTLSPQVSVHPDGGFLGLGLDF
ncbi:hypothetical protein [Vulgatibacter sp.]|uniref:hypothetical protein n=1 Tax=Vulgatibacter sp. TaxID=1971226 RepID=UPI003563C2AF